MRQLRALHQFRESFSHLELPLSKQWLWKLLGFSSGTAAVMVSVQQVLTPDSTSHQAVHELQERLSTAGAWVREAVVRASRPRVEVPPSPHQPASVQGYAARFLADWCSQPERSQLAVALGGGPLLDWLLDAATDSTQTLADIAEQEQAERALAHLLQSDATAALVVERPGAVPRLLRHCQAQLLNAGSSSNPATPSRSTDSHALASASPAELLLHALEQRAAAGLLSQPTNTATRGQAEQDRDGREGGEDGSIAGMMHWILGSSAAAGEANGWTQGEAFLSDLEEVTAMLLQGTSIAEVSGLESEGVVMLPRPGANSAIVQLTNPAQPLPAPSLPHQGEPIQGPAVTAGDDAETNEERLRLQRLCASWLASWAEAHTSNRDKLTGLNVAAAITHVAAQVSERAGSQEARALQLQLVRLVVALAQGPAPLASYMRGGLDMPTRSLFQPLTPSTGATHATTGSSTNQPGISDIPAPATAQYHLAGCLQPLLYITADAAVEHDSSRAVAALAAIRSVLLQGGLPVAAAAAAEPLLPLLEKIAQGAGDMDVRGAAVRVLAAMVHSPQSLGESPVVSQHVTAWRDWLLATLCQDKGDAAQEALRADCAEALAELAALPGVTGLQVTHYWLAALLASLATRVWPYNAVVYTGPKDQVILPRPLHPSSHDSGDPSPGSFKAPPPTTLPAGTSIDARDFVDAVPVLPAHIKSVSAALEEASAAVVEEHEPPVDFDLGSTGSPAPLARTFYKQVARTVDVLVAEKRVCQALEVLNALVAADPTKQQWLLSVGVLPLLYRLCNPSDPNTLLDPLAAGHRGGARGAGQAQSEGSEAASGPSAASGFARWVGGMAAGAGKSLASRITGLLPTRLKRAPQGAEEGGAPRPAPVSTPSPDVQQSEVIHDTSQEMVTEPQETDTAELDVNTDHEGPSHLCLRRQVARLLALLAVQPAARGTVGGPLWLPWLEAAARDADCRLASHATRALLNLAAFRPRPAEDSPSPSPGAAAVRPAPPAPVYLDQVHLLNPGAPHLWTLAQSGSRPHSQQVLQLPAMAPAQQQPGPAIAMVPAGAVPLTASPHEASISTSGTGHHTSNTMAAIQPAALTAPQELEQEARNCSTAVGSWAVRLTDTAGNLAGSAFVLLSSVSSQAMHLVAPSWAMQSVDGSVAAPTPLRMAAAGLTPGNSPAAAAAFSATQSLPLTASSGWFGGAESPATLYAGQQNVASSRHQTEPARGNLIQLEPPSASDAGAARAAEQGVQHLSTQDLSQTPGSEHNPSLQPGDCCPDNVSHHPLLHYALMGPGSVAPLAYAEGPVRRTQQGRQPTGEDAHAPLIDVVFVHGIRGGPFITWRKPGTAVKGTTPSRRSAAFLCMSDCWPSDWLPRDAPRARLLTVEYLAPVSGWEGESLPLEATVERVMGQLQAAGVGQRPLVFVAHSMGGLLVKEMLVRSMHAAELAKASAAGTDGSGVQVAAGPEARFYAERSQLAQATQGIVFFATPHFGSGMAAMGWKLRHMPYANPAPALAQLTPGPHLVELNDSLRLLSERRPLRVVSAVEGQPTQLSPVIPKVLIVPEASAWPGFGQLLPLPTDDHISLCKPINRQAPAYTAVLGVIQDVLRQAAKEQLLP